MALFERIIYLIFPDLIVSGTPWRDIWRSQRREEFAGFMRLVFLVVAVVYVGHYFFFDRVLDLQPTELWFQFRFGMAAIAVLCSLFYYFPFLYRFDFYKLPMMIGLGLVCYTQAKVSVWYPPASYLFAVSFTYLSAVLLQSSAFKSIIFAIIMYAIQTPVLSEAGVSSSMLYSTGVVLVAMTLFSRLGYLAEVKYFVANLENLEAQKKIIELNIEVATQIKAFLPKEISDRLNHCMNERKMNVIQATDEILRPKKKEVSCLFSDIRGFTQNSKDLDIYVNQGVFPNVKACTEVVDSFGGIPRKIGDLLFAYFDQEGIEVSLLNAVVAGMQISKTNAQQAYARSEFSIERYILISTGYAVVGNLGGFNSSIEITAIGTPVNFLSRLDSLTKEPSLKLRVKKEDLILDSRSVEILKGMLPEIEIQVINIHDLGLKIRDFENISQIYIIPYTERNINLIESLYEYVEGTTRRSA